MISRRIIRIKVLQILYAYYSSPDELINNHEKELFFCIRKSYDLYHYLLLLVIDIADYAERRIDINRAKHRPTEEDLNPNTKFIDNKMIGILRKNKSLNLYLEQKKMSWVNNPELIKELYNRLSESDFYKEYMNDGDFSFDNDRRLVDRIFNKLILLCEELYQVLEEQSIYWNDDVEFNISMISKTLKRFTEYSREDLPLLPMFKDEDDRQFTKDLFRKAILNHKELRSLIDLHSQNWDLDRIAFVDILIMQLALAEFLYFPNIPTKVTLNEYIELSKYYSTEKSRNFINGILDKALKQLKEDGKIKKTGRGLIGES
ncbi:MAG: transcription antitermination factor NusB [Prolixibacteraceae bacterium]|nr:transcription antitermination factor NusB [Prolixibacteraceae bacterium]MBN2772935.1 transcription antitermination factor NusB [Prolixibacteraceae bacterium]